MQPSSLPSAQSSVPSKIQLLVTQPRPFLQYIMPRHMNAFRPNVPGTSNMWDGWLNATVPRASFDALRGTKMLMHMFSRTRLYISRVYDSHPLSYTCMYLSRSSRDVNQLALREHCSIGIPRSIHLPSSQRF